jgi:hypothetical protein
MDKYDFRAAKCSFQTIGIDDVLEFKAWCLAYADDLITLLETTQVELTKAKKQNELSEDCMSDQLDQITILHKQLDASHAVNDVYKNMIKVSELTIELLETNGEE